MYSQMWVGMLTMEQNLDGYCGIGFVNKEWQGAKMTTVMVCSDRVRVVGEKKKFTTMNVITKY